MRADDTGTFSALRARLERRSEEDASQVVSILEVIQKLKEQIRDKDRIIGDKTGQLLATRDYLKSVFAALADPVLVVDPDGRLEFANDAAVELIDTPRDRLVGRPASGLWADPDQAALFEGERLAEVFRFGIAQRTDMRLRTRRGDVPVSWSSSVLRVDGKPAGLVGIARDVRVERRLEEEKLRAVQALAASVAHEIRNPLGAILNSVSLLRRDLDVAGEDRALMDIVCEETERISKIVARFLSFARPPQPELVLGDVGELLREVLLLAERDERAEAGRQFLLHVDPALPEVAFDPDLIKQVVWNLLANALDAAQGRIAIRARCARGGGVEVRVADDGPGMPPEVLARATEPFRTTKAQGSGLGLAITKQIIEVHRGGLRLESVLGAGTAISFTLPSAAAAAALGGWSDEGGAEA